MATFPEFIRQWGFDHHGKYKFGCSKERVLCLFESETDKSVIVAQLTPENWKPGRPMVFKDRRGRDACFVFTPERFEGHYNVHARCNGRTILKFDVEDCFLNLENWGYGNELGPMKWWDSEWHEDGSITAVKQRYSTFVKPEKALFTPVKTVPATVSQVYQSTLSAMPANRMCFDNHGNLVVTVSMKNEVRVYDTSANLLLNVGEGQHKLPWCCVISPDSRFFVSEYEDACVKIFRSDGTFEKKIALQRPSGLALHSDTLYVCASHAFSDALYAVNTTSGSLVRKVLLGAVAYQPDVAVLSNGHVVVDTWIDSTGVIRIFDCDGTCVRSFGGDVLSLPRQLAVDANDNIYVANRGASSVVVFSASGVRTELLDKFEYPHSIAISKSGELAVGEAVSQYDTTADSGMGRIQLFGSVCLASQMAALSLGSQFDKKMLDANTQALLFGIQ